MKILFKGKYKSLSTFESEELPDFTVITGKNGSGKSQLINAMNREFNSIPNADAKVFNISILPTPQKILVDDLKYKGRGQVTHAQFRPLLDNFTNRFKGLTPALKDFYNLLYDKNISITALLSLEPEDIKKLTGIKDVGSFAHNLVNGSGIYINVSKNEVQNFRQFRSVIERDSVLSDFLLLIKKSTGKHFNTINDNDFYSTSIPEHFVDNSDLFSSLVENIFLNYLKRREANDRLMYRKDRYNEDNEGIPDEEFIKKYPVPWDIINRILGDANVNLKVIGYNLKDYSSEISINIQFIKEDLTEPIGFADLSSGEQVIIGLIVKIFTKDYYKTGLQFPDVLILDEAEAYLHPEMSKLLIDVLYNSFVKELGIKVILTTHSPATVALAPEDSIYEMRNTPSSSLKKISKDDALELLTGSLPTLSIGYKNHRQVFLESPTDFDYFQKLYNKLKTEEKLNYKLYFLSNDKGSGNCVWVKDIVRKLREAGVNKFYGIIDWDTNNKSNSEIFVHGENSRYSVENFLYDAIYFAILFLEMGGAGNIRKELSIEETYPQYKLATEVPIRQQEIWDWFTGKIIARFPVLKRQPIVSISYHSGEKVNVPEWYLSMQGHELAKKIRESFPFLNGKYPDEALLTEDLSIIMAKCYPFVPADSVELLKGLAT